MTTEIIPNFITIILFQIINIVTIFLMIYLIILLIVVLLKVNKVLNIWISKNK